jgi:protein phosphatase
MQIDYAAITHPGRVRKNNEDAFLLSALNGDEPLINQALRPLPVAEQGFLAAVADGMGGAAAGEVASREGLAAVSLHLFGHWGRLQSAELTEERLLKAIVLAVEEASQAILRYSDDDRTARGMGSTLTAAVIWNNQLYVAQVGDSRAYLFRQGQLQQITVDQTLVNELVLSGTLTAEEARTHPQRNMITQALGSPQQIVVVVYKVALRRGDRFLLCSDGLHGEVEDTKIQALLAMGHSPRKTLESLLEAALESGARDNVTGVILGLNDPLLPLPKPEEKVEIVKPLLPTVPKGWMRKVINLFGGGA